MSSQTDWPHPLSLSKLTSSVAAQESLPAPNLLHSRQPFVCYSSAIAASGAGGPHPPVCALYQGLSVQSMGGGCRVRGRGRGRGRVRGRVSRVESEWKKRRGCVFMEGCVEIRSGDWSAQNQDRERERETDTETQYCTERHTQRERPRILWSSCL